MAQKKTQEGSSTSTNPKLAPNLPTNTEKEPTSGCQVMIR